jgi:hypothetical protein
MNGPSNSERDVLDTALVWLERGLILAGGMVVVGLLMESGPEMAIALQKHHFPNRGVLGGALVTMGVFAEVVLGILITQKSHRVQDLADASIAKANERAVQAAKETAEANLARVKLEAKLVRRTTSRLLSAEEEEILTKSLSVHAGERFALVLSNLDPEGLMPINRTAERIFFAGQLQKILSAAGWIDDGTLGLPDLMYPKE